MPAAGLLTTPLVGRAAELAEIDLAVKSVATGTPRSVAVVGEPGIGKTALVHSACKRAEDAGLLVLSGRATEFEGEAPFGMFVDALDGILGDQDPTWLAGIGKESLGELAAVFPSLSGLGGRGSTRLQAERFRFHHAVRAVLELLAAEQPLTLALDDVHWGDRSSVELLAYLLRHGLSAPVLLLFTYRSRPVPEWVWSAVAAASRDGSLTALELEPLSEAQAEVLLDGALSEEARGAVYREGGGNPFYMLELARVRERSDLRVERAPDHEDEPGSVPFGVREAIALEVAAASPTARALLNAAGILGEPIDLELATRVAELGEAEGLEALDELERLGLIRTTDIPGRYAFRHPIVRRAIHESAGTGFQIAAHRRAAEVLAEWGAPAVARAHHVEQSARFGDPEAVDVLMAAARATALRAPMTAARWLTAAVQLLPHDTPPERRLELLLELARALGSSGRVEDSRASLAEALALLPGDQVVLKARLAGAIARLDHMVARHGEARQLLERAIADSGPDPSLGLTALKVELAMDHWFADDRKDMVAVAREARRDAERIGDRVSYATAAGLEAVGLGYLGQLGAARAAADDAARVIDNLPDADLAARLEALVVLSHAEFGLIERGSDCARHAERGVAISRATSQETWYPMLLSATCLSNLMLGRMEAASEAADAAEESSRLGHVQTQIWALALRCWVDLIKGDLRSALDHGEEAVAMAQLTGTTSFHWLAHGCLAMVLLKVGQPARAREMILSLAGGPDLERIECRWVPHWYQLLTLAELANGDLDAARRWAERSKAAVEVAPTPGRIGEVRSSQAAVELESGQFERAAELALEAAESFVAADWPIDAARARTLAGRALAALQRHDEANRVLREAHATLEASGAIGYRDEVARELRRLGERPPRRGRRGGRDAALDTLTAREREVAELVARGLTNRQIAAQLFVSPKTVESHLTRVFAKTGLPSRAAVAAAVERWHQKSNGR